METLKQIKTIEQLKEINQEELLENKTYFVFTELGEIEPFEYLGNGDILLTDYNIISCLFKTDIIFA